MYSSSEFLPKQNTDLFPMGIRWWNLELRTNSRQGNHSCVKRGYDEQADIRRIDKAVSRRLCPRQICLSMKLTNSASFAFPFVLFSYLYFCTSSITTLVVMREAMPN
ncbi:hypothetical protein BJX64DRAFT_259753 [Aspergillus heterothallicus]